MAVVKLGYSTLPMTTATANTTYVLDADENRTIQSGWMIDLDPTEGLKFVLNGTLHSDANMFTYGTLGQDAPGIEIVIGKTGFLDSKYDGIFAVGDGSEVVNHGIISSGTGEAIEMHGDGLRVRNSGVIISDSYAISLSGTDIRLENTGVINGNVMISSDLGSSSIFVNSGQVNSASIAVLGGAGDDTFINTGLVRVGVRLHGGDDRFIDRGGRVTSAIQGGDGDDLYMIRSKNYDLRESADEGFDTVKTSVSWTLDQYFEVGRLTGRADINLTSNNGGAFLYGNAGENKLIGSFGIDWLDGGRGNDILAGYGNNDVFVFKAGCGDDIVREFTDNEDRLNLQSYKGIEGFGDLGVKQDGNDVVISLRGGDTVTLRNFDKGDLSDADFMF